MSKSRREFLAQMAASVLGAAVSPELIAQQQPTPPSKPGEPPAGTPPAFGTAPPVGPEVSPSTFADAEKLVRVEMTPAERTEAAGNWRSAMAPLYERRSGPRKVAIDPDDAPYSLWNPVLPGEKAGPERNQFIAGRIDAGPLPKNEEDIAFAPVTHLASWIHKRQITSARLTEIYLDRLKRFGPKLRCVITLTSDLATEQAKQADHEIAAGKYRGPLHGIPWGAKDLLDTAGIPTTYGAEPYRNRVPKDNAAVVKRLHNAGAVLVAKLSLGALALNDVWFGGQTLNPWNLDEGSSGSSAGPGAATSAGLVGFAIGSETGGSIIG
ncbi:MAG: amidase family protein, partial [Actinomycetota bacterium]